MPASALTRVRMISSPPGHFSLVRFRKIDVAAAA
jgi:hypothetical protein